MVLVAGLRHSPQKGIIPSPLIGKPAPQFTLPNLFDRQRSRCSTRHCAATGRWSTSGAPGASNVAPSTDAAADQQQGACRSSASIGRTRTRDALAWLQQLGNPYERIGADHDGRVAIDWGVYGAPESFLISPTGTIVYKHIGALTPQVWQREFLPRIGAAANRTAGDL